MGEGKEQDKEKKRNACMAAAGWESGEAKCLGIDIVVWKEIDNIYTFEKRGREGKRKKSKKQ